ncbi:MAG TPA: Gfo/Idh/MocA family oxidoreductase, partial [Vicinamibacteria bacterium]
MRSEEDAGFESVRAVGSGTSRRDFLKAAAIGAPLVVSSGVARRSDANSRITLGVIGNGGRGTWITNLFQKHGGYEIRAATDYFPDRVEAFGAKFQIPADRRYSGLLGYRRLLESDVDAVVIQSPPYFHPGQAQDAVEAGKHVFLAKPIAVDVPGCRTVEESAKKAAEKKRAFLVDFQTRTDP